MKVAVLYICTGRYNQFFKEFYESSEKYFLKGIANIEYFIFTDNMELCKNEKVHLFYRECQGFPMDSLFKFEMFLLIEEQIKSFDYIYFLNSNAKVMSLIGEEILPDESGLVAALWPSRETQPVWSYPYERDKKSLAYIAPNQPPYFYFMGGINGGTAKDYLEMIHTCAKNIRKDFDDGIIARVHDESHINKYLHTHKCKVLTREYCWPEEWNSDFSPKLILRDKVKIDPYFNKGRNHSLWGKIQKCYEVLYNGLKWYV